MDWKQRRGAVSLSFGWCAPGWADVVVIALAWLYLIRESELFKMASPLVVFDTLHSMSLCTDYLSLSFHAVVTVGK